MSDVHHPSVIDPDAETARAKRELRRRLDPYVPAMIAARLAAAFIDWLTEQGWRPPARTRPWRTAPPPADPEAAARGAARARQALTDATQHTETQTEEGDPS